MALAKCRECGSEVSTGAKSCPKCGISRPGTTNFEMFGGAMIFIAMVIGGVAWMNSGSDVTAKPTVNVGVTGIPPVSTPHQAATASTQQQTAKADAAPALIEVDLSKYIPADLRDHALYNFDHKFDGKKYLIVVPLGLVLKEPSMSGRASVFKLEAREGATNFPVGLNSAACLWLTRRGTDDQSASGVLPEVSLICGNAARWVLWGQKPATAALPDKSACPVR